MGMSMPMEAYVAKRQNSYRFSAADFVFHVVGLWSCLEELTGNGSYESCKGHFGWHTQSS